MFEKLTANVVDKSAWRAWFNVMRGPGSIPTLHVHGSIDVENEGSDASLEFEAMTKSLPPTLILRIVPKTIFIPREKGDTKITLHYFQHFAPGQIGSIIILYPDDTSVTIDSDSIGIAH